MPTRSQYKILQPLPDVGRTQVACPATPKSTSQQNRPAISKVLLKDEDEEQCVVIHDLFSKKFKMIPRKLQVDATISLVRQRDVFLLASTGYGKSRIPEIFYLMFTKSCPPIILTLNPLDALGDNQVSYTKTSLWDI